MRVNSLLASTGYKRDKTSGKYVDPVTERKVSLETAKDRASKFYGYKNFAQAKEAFASKAYSRIVQGGYKTKKSPTGRLESFAKQNKIPIDYRLQKLFANAWKAKHKSSSKELADLLKYVGKISKGHTRYGPPL